MAAARLPSSECSPCPGGDLLCRSRWAPVSLKGASVSATGFGFPDVHSPSLTAATHRASAISLGPIYDPEAGKRNLSPRSKELISLLGCLRSSDVIIIPTKALASVRLISTTAADTIIKAPGFLCSKSYTDEACKVRFGGKTNDGIFLFSLPCSPSRFLPYRDQGEAASMSPMRLENRPRPSRL